jgi:hypothetical protein
MAVVVSSTYVVVGGPTSVVAPLGVGLHWKRHVTQLERLVPHVGVDDAAGVVHPEQEPVPDGYDPVGLPRGNLLPLALVVNDRQPLELSLPAAGSKQAQLGLHGLLSLVFAEIQRRHQHLVLGSAHESYPSIVHIAFLFRPPILLLSEVARRQKREGRRTGGVGGSVASGVDEVVG